MPNRTISLDDVSDAIRKTLVSKGVNFSHWVRMQLRNQDAAAIDQQAPKPRVPPNYMCRNCLGNHWTVDCPTLGDEV
jgi:hypothetical protein